MPTCLECGYTSDNWNVFYGVVNDECVLCEKCWDEAMYGTGKAQDKKWKQLTKEASG